MNRNDIETAIKVNHGIAIAELEGAERGAAFMAANGVPFDVAHRVLMYPRMRRSYDWR